jgi:TonB family protein
MRKTTFVGTLSFCNSLFYLIALGMVCLPTHAQDATPAAAITKDAPAAALPSDPKELMLLAARSNGLRGPDVQPWYMKVSFTLFDDTGAVTDEGTFEEFWVSTYQFKVVIKSRVLSLTDYGTGSGVLRAGAQNPESDLLDKAVREYEAPVNLAETTIKNSKFDLQKPEMGGTKLLCLTRKTPLGEPAQGLAGITYCLDTDLLIVRTAVQPDDLRQFVHEKTVKFQGRYIAGDLDVVNGRNVVLKAHLDQLEPLKSIHAEDFIPPQGATLMPNVYILPASDGRQQLTKHPKPQYPPIARAAHVYGTVVLQAHIGIDGRVSSLYVVSGPAMLQQAALDAVWNWTYKPYKSYDSDGKKSDVITIVEVSFPKSLTF